MLWWAWLLVGFLLVAAELLTPGGFYLLFFGLGGIVVGLLGLAGIVLPAWGQWLLFSALSIGATLIFRKPLLDWLQKRMPQPQADDLARRDRDPGRSDPPRRGRQGRAARHTLERPQRRDAAARRRRALPRRRHGRTATASGARKPMTYLPLFLAFADAQEKNPLASLLTMSVIVPVALALLVLIVIAKTAVVVPQQSAYVVERLGRYAGTLGAGFHFLFPFIDVLRYRLSLKEQALDIPEQVCITRDNVQVGVDGVIYLKVMNPERASYGVQDYFFAISQLAQTTLRSEVGKIDLDRTFEERSHINGQVVSELDKASEPWGVKVLRYEIKNIVPPKDVLSAMEKQMRAEREKRAVILTSEGERDARINEAEGEKQQVIKASEATRQRQINEAEGQAQAILAVASATAEGLRRVAETIQNPGGREAVQLRVAEQWVAQFGNLAKSTNTVIVPAPVGDVAAMIATAMNVFAETKPRA